MTTSPSGGRKEDTGKPRPSLVTGGLSRAVEAVVEVATYGAGKYADNGWESVDNGVQRYTDAMVRHLLAETRELRDPESGFLHAAAVACNALIRLELMLREEPCSGSQSQ